MNIQANVKAISNWSTSALSTIKSKRTDIDQKSQQLTNQFFDANDLFTKMELSDSIRQNISQFNETERTIKTDVQTIKALFKGITKEKGGFTENQMSAYLEFQSSKALLLETLSKTKADLEKASECIESSLAERLVSLETVMPKQDLPPIDKLMKGSEALKYFALKKITQDGNCLFSAVSYIAYDTEAKQNELRAICCEHLQVEEFGAQYLLDTPHAEEGLKDYYEGWCVRRAEEANPTIQIRTSEERKSAIETGKKIIQEELKNQLPNSPTAIDMYKAFMRQDTSHGGEIELVTLTDHFKRPIIVFKGAGDHIDAQSEGSLFGKQYSDQPPMILYNKPGHYEAYIPKSR